jgi:hypothetical protein
MNEFDKTAEGSKSTITPCYRVKLPLPSWMIWMSFRYVLGRTSYAPGMWMNWAKAAWPSIPGETRELVLREIEEYLNYQNRMPDARRDDRLNREWKHFVKEVSKKEKR